MKRFVYEVVFIWAETYDFNKDNPFYPRRYYTNNTLCNVIVIKTFM